MYSRCQKCGKTLTDPESMKRGYGPECWALITGAPAKNSGKEPVTQIDGQMSFADIFDIIGGSDEADTGLS